MERLRLASALLAASAPIAFAAVDPQMTPTPLRVTQAIDVHGEQTEPASVHGSVQSFAFQGPSRCDADGNLYLLPRPSETSGRSTNAVLRISAAGVKSEFDLPTALDLRTGETARINAMALDVEGAVYVLGVFGSDETRRSIISLDNQGHVRSKHVLDESTMAVDRFAVFRGGDFLLVGRHPSTSEPRIALAGVSRPLQQLSWPFTPSGHAPARIHVEPGSDGNVYVAQETGTRVYAISEAGEVSGHFELVRPQSESTSLVSLYLSGRRLAAVHMGKRPDSRGSVNRWVVVQDVSTGEHLAMYGPITKMLTCYRSLGTVDQFTMLSVTGGNWQLLLESAP
jgi:hypothetical protein